MLLPNTPGGRAAKQTLDKIRSTPAPSLPAVHGGGDAATADNITNSRKYTLSSDEFLTRADVGRQLDKLRSYIAEQRSVEPGYAIPRPVGWRMTALILLPPEQSSGGVFLPGDAVDAHNHKSITAVVLYISKSAQQDKGRFPVGPWVNVGDRLIFRRYSASHFELANGQVLATLDDTMPLGVIDGGWNVEGMYDG